MLKTVLFSILFTFVILIVRAQSLPTKKEQNDFLKWYVQTRNLVPLDSIKYNSPFHVDLTNIPLLTQFTKNERSFLLKQTINGRQLLVDSTTLKTRLFVDTKKQQVENYINFLSMPAFTSDRKMVFISWSIWCGEACGEESIDIFIKTAKGKWRKLKTVVPVIMF
ncbi:hypothetical protein [Mucilaginibacter auburnensis]|uniref:Uncharacterized protein n=1 Tax=Mucilaginibacter auburnensis TaxID=1457233 RepID=A0A2H9VPU1_9SPHI|nr:hypothetical protein [Mucilaginibacter auburnensis]PJJ80353.1 hypothetical protein CLV57_3503 [Mucilaginibacter auburnensis]